MPSVGFSRRRWDGGSAACGDVRTPPPLLCPLSVIQSVRRKWISPARQTVGGTLTLPVVQTVGSTHPPGQTDDREVAILPVRQTIGRLLSSQSGSPCGESPLS